MISISSTNQSTTPLSTTIRVDWSTITTPMPTSACQKPTTKCILLFFFSSRRRHTRFKCDWSSDVCSSDLNVQGRVNYTWSHNIDDSTGVFNGLGESRGTNGGPANPFNLAGEKSNSSLDRRHLFIANVIWDLPFGHNQRYGSSASGGLDKLIGGWQWNIIESAGSGQPFGILSDSGIGRIWADQNCANSSAGAAFDRYLNAACFALPANTVTNLAGGVIPVGNTGRNPYVGPSYNTTDFSVFKNTSFGERYKVQFGMEFFNLWNKVNKVVPNTFLDNVNNNSCKPGNAQYSPGVNCPFGRFDSALPPRQIQYRLMIFL